MKLYEGFLQYRLQVGCQGVGTQEEYSMVLLLSVLSSSFLPAVNSRCPAIRTSGLCRIYLSEARNSPAQTTMGQLARQSTESFWTGREGKKNLEFTVVL